ncbi:hypothetical protein ES703_51598 [subsurface metagenome]
MVMIGFFLRNDAVFIIGFLVVAVLLICLGWREKRRGADNDGD